MINLYELSVKYSDKKAYQVDEEFITYKELYIKSLELSKNIKGSAIIYGHKEIYMIIAMCACLIKKVPYIFIDERIPKTRGKNIIKSSKAMHFINENGINNLKSNYEFDNIAYIMFTSGSTGNPKGVPISYDNLSNFIEFINNVFKDLEIKKILNTANFNFDLSVTDIYYSLSNGLSLYSCVKKNMIDYIKNNNIDLIVLTPTYLKMLLLHKDFNCENISLKVIFSCGELLDSKLAKKLKTVFPNIILINAYGPTETCVAVSSVVIKDITDLLPCGYVNEFIEINIIEDEIVIRGKSVFNGYLNSEVKTNGIYYTGDLGYIKDNYLYCLGRKDNQIKYSGYRIDLGDIERNIKKLDYVEDVVVNFIDNKYLVAYVIGEINKLKEDLSLLLPKYMVPKKIVKVSCFPVTDNGKIDRSKLNEY